VRSPAGAEPTAVRRFGSTADGSAVVTGDHWIDVPLEYHHAGSRSAGGGAADRRIALYAREVRALDLVDTEQPYLVFLQGGPGGRSPRPGVDAPGWLAWALRRYRVILLDQRGTGRSTPADRHTLTRLGPPHQQAEYLAHFRADAIVADAERLREHLLGDVPWTALGQSFGGFCVWTYLSQSPDGLAAALVTGGIPPMSAHPDDVYRATFRAVQRRTADLDAAHPGVRRVLADVARHLQRTDEFLPTGERLTVARLQEVGQVLGVSNGIDLLANLADDAWALEGERLSDGFLASVADLVSFARQPLYAVVHEACYAERGIVTDWSAERVRAELGVPDQPVPGDTGEVLPLTGEMIFPATVASDPALRDLSPVAALIADRAWEEPLYSPSRLSACTVPVAARLYTQDMFVDVDLSRATAAMTGTAPGARPVTVIEDAIHHHDGLRRAGGDVLEPLAQALGDAVPEAIPADSSAQPPAGPTGRPPGDVSHEGERS
jgi:pimeloyl-ACP methyl ester carboxylesterase